MKGHPFSVFLPFLSLLLLAGCGTPASVREGKLGGEHFTVAGSSLDWLEISYTPLPGDPDFPMPFRLSFFGSGEMVCRSGRSPLVWDDFSTRVDDPNWNDFRIDRIHIGETEMTALMQSMVDAGVVPPAWSRMSAGEMPRPPMVRLRGKISGKAVARQTDNRTVVRIIERQARRFGKL